MAKKSPKKFKTIEKDVVIDKANITKPTDIEWEGEELTAKSKTNIESDTGEGVPVVIRFFEFAANPETFKKYGKPPAQDLFNNHLKFLEGELWKDGLKFFTDVEPRLQFSKDYIRYRFAIPAIGQKGISLKGETKTLSQLLTNAKS